MNVSGLPCVSNKVLGAGIATRSYVNKLCFIHRSNRNQMFNLLISLDVAYTPNDFSNAYTFVFVFS